MDYVSRENIFGLFFIVLQSITQLKKQHRRGCDAVGPCFICRIISLGPKRFIQNFQKRNIPAFRKFFWAQFPHCNEYDRPQVTLRQRPQCFWTFRVQAKRSFCRDLRGRQKIVQKGLSSRWIKKFCLLYFVSSSMADVRYYFVSFKMY